MEVFNGNTEIVNNSYDDTDFTQDKFTSQSLCINPAVEDNYLDFTSDNIDEVYAGKQLEELMNELYENSEWWDKYGKQTKKIERSDISEMYYYFKNKLLESRAYNLVQIFCVICEFFDFNYKLMYNDIISLKDKAIILDLLEETHGLEKQFSKSVRLF